VPLAFSGSVDLVRSKGAARELAATLQSARNRALARNQIVAVNLDAASGQFRIGTDGEARVLPEGVRLTLVELEKTDDGTDRGRIRFFPDGSSTGGALQLDDGARRFRISVHWLLGRVDVTQGDTT
jgi:general secretion pathway protein H